MTGRPTPLEPIEERVIDFHGDTITAAFVLTHNGPAVYVPVRPLCSYLGLDWSAQYRRILRDPVLSEAAQGVAITTTPSQTGRGGGSQSLLALPLDMLHGWLFGVAANRVKPEHREALIRYQRDCYRVLWAALRPDESVTTALAEVRTTALAVAAQTTAAPRYRPTSRNTLSTGRPLRSSSGRYTKWSVASTATVCAWARSIRPAGHRLRWMSWKMANVPDSAAT
jgi:hypothetical protein